MAGSLFSVESSSYGKHSYCVSPEVAIRSREISNLVKNPIWHDVKMAEFDTRATTATSSSSRHREPVPREYGLELASLTVALATPIEPARLIYVMNTLAQVHPDLVRIVPRVRGTSRPLRNRRAA